MTKSASISISHKGTICNNCVLDTSVVGIRLDNKGICQYCNQFFEERSQMILSPSEKNKKLEKFINLIKSDGKNKPYDCIIGLSGGVDSSYVAWLLKQHGIRPLAVHFDNGWNTEIAVGNIEHICQKLNIELFTYVVDWEEFKDLQLSFLKAGVANAEIPTDHGIFATLYNLANKFKVKYIVDGLNHATEFVRKDFTASGWVYSDLKQLKAIHKKFGSVPLRTFPMMSLYKKARLQKVNGIQTISILNYVDYVKSDAIKLLQSEVAWRSYGAKHHESTFTKWHQVVYLPTRFGFDKRKMHLSDLVLFKQITREEALNELTKPLLSADERRQLDLYVQKKLGLSEDDYNKLLNSPAVEYSQYPNDAFIINLYKKFKGSL
jgi:N-acetyl sugar amidotransferase